MNTENKGAEALPEDQIEAIARSHGTGGWQTLPDMVKFGKACILADRARTAPAHSVGEDRQFAELASAWSRDDSEPYILDAAGRNTWQALIAHIDSLLTAARGGSGEQPKLVLAMPDYETRTIVVASDDVIDGERLVCVAIKGELAASPLPEAAKAEPERRPNDSHTPAGQEREREWNEAFGITASPPQAEPVSTAGAVGMVCAKPENEHGTLTWPRVVWKDGLFAMPPVGTKLYATPPAVTAPDMSARDAKPLNEVEIHELAIAHGTNMPKLYAFEPARFVKLIRDVERRALRSQPKGKPQ